MWDGEKHRAQVEHKLGRALTDEELVVVSDLPSLPASHLDVIEALYRRRDGISALLYLLAVTPDVDRSELMEYVHNFDQVIDKRYPPRSGLSAQQLYESNLGRPLTADEIVRSANLHTLNEAQCEVARVLAAKDRYIALHYLAELVPTSTPQERQVFLENRPRRE